MKSLSKTKIFALVAGLCFFGLIGLVVAQINIPGIPTIGPQNVTGVVDVVRNIVKWVYIIFFIIAVLFIILAAFTYLTAGGDEEKVKKAKDQIIYATIAIVVALLAISFEAIIKNFLASGQ